MPDYKAITDLVGTAVADFHRRPVEQADVIDGFPSNS